jgi:hypothetical protein
MKSVYKFFTITSLAILISLSSCESWIDPDFNISPNSPSDVPLNLLMPSAASAIAYSYAGDYARFPAIWMQHLSGVDRQAYGFELYNQGESDINNLWNTIYGGALKDLAKAKEKATALGAIHYIGVINVMTAHALGILTDAWDDIPYSQALIGETQLKSPYDTQQKILDTINQLLDQAITEFGKPNPTGVPAPGTVDDLLYKGSIPKWTAAAKSLKLRYALHKQKRDGNWNAVGTIINGGGLIASNADNFQFNFGAASVETGPVFNFDTNRGDIRVGAYIVNLMNANSDPRRPRYFSGAVTPAFTVPATFVGSNPGAQLTSANWTGPAFASRNSPAYYMTFAEVKFIEAEWRLRTSAAGAANALRAAVTASLEQYGVGNADWVTTNYGSITDANITIQNIILAKYTHLFMQPEAWNDWKRTGIPTFTPAVGNVTAGVIPRRFIYSQDERLYNGDNMPKDKKITDRVWWDVQ